MSSQLDAQSSYISHAISRAFGVIDVNIPEYITLPESTSHDPLTGLPHVVDHASNNSDLARREGEKLAAYLWENYIESLSTPANAENREIILMGSGHAFHAVTRLISENDTVYQSLSGVVGFVATHPVRPVKNNGNPWVSGWYRENSLVFVSNTNGLWKKEGKVSKRYGRLEGSEGTCLNEMMMLEERKVWEWIGLKLGADLLGQVKEEDDTDDDDQTDDNGHDHGHGDETESDEEVKQELETGDEAVGNGAGVVANDVVMSTEQS